MEQFATLIGSAGCLAAFNLLGCYFEHTLKRSTRRKAALQGAHRGAFSTFPINESDITNLPCL